MHVIYRLENIITTRTDLQYAHSSFSYSLNPDPLWRSIIDPKFCINPVNLSNNHRFIRNSDLVIFRCQRSSFRDDVVFNLVWLGEEMDMGPVL